MPEIASQQQAMQWYNLISDWPNFWANFQKNFQGLLAQGPFIQRHPSLKADWESQVRQGSVMFQKLLAVDNTISGIKARWGDFTGWLKGTFGMSGLGFLPAIPVAIGIAMTLSLVAAATVLLSSWSNRAARYQIIKDEEAKGATPEQAERTATAVAGSASSSGTLFGFNIKWLLIGGAAFLLLPTLLPYFRKK